MQQLFNYFKEHDFAWVCGFAVDGNFYEHLIYVLNVETVEDKKALNKIRRIIKANQIAFSANGLSKQQFYGNYFQDQMDEVKTPFTICNSLQELADTLDFIIKDSKKHPKKYCTQKILTQEAEDKLQSTENGIIHTEIEDDRCYQ